MGVGASAGGLEALESFFSHTPEDTGAAFVVVQHLSPDFKSHMESLLARQTSMRIRRVSDGMDIEANTIYLIPPRKVMVVSDMRLLLTDADPEEMVAHPIDHFFRSLAQDVKRMGVAVVLSGTGSDGARGIIDVKKAGGLTLVQDPGTARFDGMPLSALSTDQVDVVLPPETMGQALSRYITESLSPSALAEQELQVDYPNLYDAIFDLLQAEYKINFADYKSATIGRRIQRRLAMRPDDSLDDYVKVLGENRAELDILYHDLLIGVTRFFRDPEAYSKLASTVLPELFKRARRGETLRIWVPGCATGEEAYSLVHFADRRLPEAVRAGVVQNLCHRRAPDRAHDRGPRGVPGRIVSTAWPASGGSVFSRRRAKSSASSAACGRPSCSRGTTCWSSRPSPRWTWSAAATCSSTSRRSRSERCSRSFTSH